MDAVALLKALRDAAPHLTPNLTLDGGSLRVGLYDPVRGKTYRGTLEPADEGCGPEDVAADMARFAEAEAARLDAETAS
jgi:hypothetical protein